MKVKCISPRLNHIVFGRDGNGAMKPRKVQVGDTFEVAGIPEAWRGLVVALDGGEKVAVTNPADEELEGLRAEYKAKFGEAPHPRMKADTLREKIAE